MKKSILIIIFGALQLNLISGVLSEYRKIKRDTRTVEEIVGGGGNSGGILLLILVLLIILVIIVCIINAISRAKERNILKREIDEYFITMKTSFKESNIKVNNFDEMENKCKSDSTMFYEVKCAMDLALVNGIRKHKFIDKYGEEKGNKLYDKDFFIDMTKEELLDSIGEPDSIEKNVLKTKTTETWIYGNKSSGDVFTFEGELLIRFKDR